MHSRIARFPVLSLLLSALFFFPLQANAAESHGLSLFGSLKYGPDFERFDYVNPDAPKGGILRLGTIGGFDSLNPFIVKGRPASGIALIYDTLLETNYDEPSTEYGLVAESVSHPDDFSSATFTLRDEARFHDGEAIEPDDVIWTLEQLKRHPFYAAYYADVEKAEALPGNKVKFTFSAANNRELPLIVGQLPVLPKHHWQDRDFEMTSLEAPLGSGPYRVGEVREGRSITYERVEDYWGKDLPINIGRHNFGAIRYDYFGDTTVILEALRGDAIDFRLENSAKNWATAYDIPAVRNELLVTETLKTRQAQGMQAFVFNIRRDKFADPRVRQAFNHAFDFEWLNKTIFYDQYTRTDSFFEGSELEATGTPEGLELEILEPLRGQVPETVFTADFENPVTDGSGNNRRNLRTAGQLLEEAGWTLQGGKRVNAETGEAMEVEFLLVAPTFERVVTPYSKALERLGIRSSIRTVDTSQYQNRLDTYNFDIVIATFAQSLSPGNEQRDFWGSEAADKPGGRNLIGIKDPAVDTLIDRIIFAKDREELVAATRALDRVLLANHFVVPQWFIDVERVAYWTRIARPEPTPDYSIGFPSIWWYDAEGAERIGARRGAGE